MSRTTFSSLAIAATLALLIIATRTHHFATSLHLPDASLAAFFLAGRYLMSRFAPVALLLLVAGIDYIAITNMGVSDFCVSNAYGFLVPAYAAMWFAGVITRAQTSVNVNSAAQLTCAVAIATTIAFVLTNGSFYWLSGRIADTTFSGYLQNASLYFTAYFSTPWLWLAGAALIETSIRLAAAARKVSHV